MNEPVNIVLCSDDNYAPYAATVIISAVNNSSRSGCLNFFLLATEMTLGVKHTLQDWSAELNIKLNIIDANVDGFKNISVGRFGKATLVRLLLHKYLPKNVNKVLYLDCDVMVLDDLDILWNESLNELSVAAVMDLSSSPEESNRLLTSGDYFNAGVMLIDVNRWKEDCIGERAEAALNDNLATFKYLDQDALNYVLAGNWKRLGFRWNFQPVSYSAVEKKYEHLVENLTDIEDAISNPAVVHFIGSVKPWNGKCDHPLKYLFLEYSKLTPWPINNSELLSKISLRDRISLLLKTFKINQRRRKTKLRTKK